jgi:hypothetical protein
VTMCVPRGAASGLFPQEEARLDEPVSS